MNTQLKLRRNSELVNQNKKKIVKEILQKLSETPNAPEVYPGERYDCISINTIKIPGVKYMYITAVVVMDYGWLTYPILVGDKENYSLHRKDGRRLEGIFQGKSNAVNYSRSLYVRCDNAVKGRRLIQVQLFLEDTHEENVIVFNEKGKIFRCAFGAMFSHDWDADSPEALARIGNDDHFFLDEDYDDFDYDDYHPDEDSCDNNNVKAW